MNKIKKIIKYFFILSLAAAYVSGYFLKENGSLENVQTHFPDKKIVKIGGSPDRYEIRNQNDGHLSSVLIVSKSQGWGGPLKLGTIIDSEQSVQQVIILSHKETPTFYQSLTNNHFFIQYQNKKINERFQVETDIDGVSGATISSKAFTKAIRKGAHWMALNEYNMIVEEIPIEWEFGSNEFILIVLYLIVVISSLKKYTKVRKFTLAFGLGFIGIYLNYPISVSNVASLSLGYFPNIQEYLFWYLLVVGTLLLTIIYGKNFYCSWICPFGAMQEFISIFGGVRLHLNQRTIHMARYMVYFLFWLSFMIMFITSNPSLGTFEPYATLFSLKGNGVQWYLVSIAIIGSFFIPRFWCRFFCPTGLILKQVKKIQFRIKQKMFYIGACLFEK